MPNSTSRWYASTVNGPLSSGNAMGTISAPRKRRVNLDVAARRPSSFSRRAGAKERARTGGGDDQGRERKTVVHDPNTLTPRNLATMFWAPFGIDRFPSPWGKQHG